MINIKIVSVIFFFLFQKTFNNYITIALNFNLTMYKFTTGIETPQ